MKQLPKQDHDVPRLSRQCTKQGQTPANKQNVTVPI